MPIYASQAGNVSIGKLILFITNHSPLLHIYTVQKTLDLTV